MYTLNIETPTKLYFTSDTHWGHFNISKYCHRPFENRSEMDKTLIENWNKVVPEDGIVIHCGDFMLPHKESIKEYEKILKKLNGNILLCRGNHDRIPLSIEPQGNLIAVVDMAILYVDNIKILASHYPMLTYPADYQVFGHIHTLVDSTCSGFDGDVIPRMRKTQYDVGVDQNNYKPISYEQLMQKLQDKK